MSLKGIDIIPHQMATRRVETRVRGGYMNHWLIRAFVDEPCAYITGGKLYVHPELVEKMMDVATPDPRARARIWRKP